jgi:hypothetical protein
MTGTMGTVMRTDGKVKMTTMATSTHPPLPAAARVVERRGRNNDRQGSNINEDDNERKDNDGGDQGTRKRMAGMAGMRTGTTWTTRTTWTTWTTGPTGMIGTMTADHHE